MSNVLKLYPYNRPTGGRMGYISDDTARKRFNVLHAGGQRAADPGVPPQVYLRLLETNFSQLAFIKKAGGVPDDRVPPHANGT